jgi:hypothetical protein
MIDRTRRTGNGPSSNGRGRSGNRPSGDGHDDGHGDDGDPPRQISLGNSHPTGCPATAPENFDLQQPGAEGRAWLLKGGRWSPCAEPFRWPSGFASSAEVEASYERAGFRRIGDMGSSFSRVTVSFWQRGELFMAAAVVLDELQTVLGEGLPGLIDLLFLFMPLTVYAADLDRLEDVEDRRQRQR